MNKHEKKESKKEERMEHLKKKAKGKALDKAKYISTKGGLTSMVKVPHEYAEKLEDKKRTKHIKSFMKAFKED